jgi:hypothetical protein
METAMIAAILILVIVLSLAFIATAAGLIYALVKLEKAGKHAVEADSGPCVKDASGKVIKTAEQLLQEYMTGKEATNE